MAVATTTSASILTTANADSADKDVNAAPWSSSPVTSSDQNSENGIVAKRIDDNPISSKSKQSIKKKGDNNSYNRHPLPSSIVQKLWDLDDNRLIPGVDYKINIQGGKLPYDAEDVASLPLFGYVNPDILLSNRPDAKSQQSSSATTTNRFRTYQLFQSLLDNYYADESIPESTTPQEKEEIMLFLNAIMETRPMKYCHRYCYKRQQELLERQLKERERRQQEQRLELGNNAALDPSSQADENFSEGMIMVPKEKEDFVKLLYYIWFEYYRRQRPKNNGDSNNSNQSTSLSSLSKNSCGFEHVFVGEVKPRKMKKNNEAFSNSDGKAASDGNEPGVVGFHNWIQFYLEELKGNLDYRGYILQTPRGYKRKNNCPSGSSNDSNDAKAEDRNHGQGDNGNRNDYEDNNGNDRILTLQFQWNGGQKPLSTIFIGTSPEFEMALYTMAFLVGERNNRVRLNTADSGGESIVANGAGVDGLGSSVFDLNVKCFRISDDDNNKGSTDGNTWRIGAAFVEDIGRC